MTSSDGRGRRVLTTWPTIVTKQEVLENNLARYLVAWLTFHELSCNFDNTGWCNALPPKRTSSTQSGFHPFALAETNSEHRKRHHSNAQGSVAGP